MVSMVRAGEVGGFLDTTMIQIADSLEADVRLRGKIKSALTYPIAVAVIAVLIVTGMLIFVVPVFSGLFEAFGGDLPLPTQLLVDLSNLVKNPMFFIPFLIVVIGGPCGTARTSSRRRCARWSTRSSSGSPCSGR